MRPDTTPLVARRHRRDGGDGAGQYGHTGAQLRLQVSGQPAHEAAVVQSCREVEREDPELLDLLVLPAVPPDCCGNRCISRKGPCQLEGASLPALTSRSCQRNEALKTPAMKTARAVPCWLPFPVATARKFHPKTGASTRKTAHDYRLVHRASMRLTT